MLSPKMLDIGNEEINVFELSDTVRLSSGENEPSLLAFFDPNRNVTRETKGRIAELVEEKGLFSSKRPLQTLSETMSNRLKVLAASKFISGYGERQRQDLARKNGRATTVIVKSFINDKLKGSTYSELLFWYRQLYPSLYKKTVKIEEAEEVCHYINTFNSTDSLALKEVAFVSVLIGAGKINADTMERMRTKSRNSIKVLRDSITSGTPVDAILLLFAQRVLFPEDFDKQTACEIYKKTKADRTFERIARCGKWLSARDLELLFMYSVVAADRVEIEDGVIWLYSDKSGFEEEYESQDVPPPVVRRF